MVQNLILNSSCNKATSIRILGQKCFYQPWEDVATLRQLFNQSIGVYQTSLVGSAPVVCLDNKEENG